MDDYDCSIENRYKQKDGRVSIELKLNNPHQLFDERDPAPFREKDLDDDAASYILSSLREIPKGTPAQLSLYFDDMKGQADAIGVIRKAVQSYFRYEEEVKRQKLRSTFKQGFISLGIGLSFLFLTIWFSHYMKAEHADMMTSFIDEGLNLMGWVSMWKPINVFLYDWWPIMEERNLLKRVSELDIEIRPLAELNKTEVPERTSIKEALTLKTKPAIS